MKSINISKVLVGAIASTIISGTGYSAYVDAEDAKIEPTIEFKELSTFEYGDDISVDVDFNIETQEITVREKDNSTVFIEDLINLEESDFHTVELLEDISTEEVGTNTAQLKVTRRDNQEVFEFEYEVEDTQKPVIKGVKDQTITEGDAFSPKDLNISAKDPVDGKLDVKFSDDYDTTTSGEYKITASAKDKNGNKTKESFTLTVKKKPKPKPAPVVHTPQVSSATPTNGTMRDDLASQMFALVNEYRQANGLSSLSWNSNIAGLAQERAKELTIRKSHIRPNGSNIRSYGVVENMKWGNTDIHSAMSWFKNSYTHRSAMLGRYGASSGAIGIYEVNGSLHIIQLYR